MTRYLAPLAAALVLAPAALADGFIPAAVQNGEGVAALDGNSRYVAVGMTGADRTMITRIATRGGAVINARPLDGTWGIPVFSVASPAYEGLSADGKALVLADITRVYPRTQSNFLVLAPGSLAIRHRIHLRGDFEFDAVSPDGRRLYLIEHRNVLDQSRYVVREVDVARERLLPGRVADRTQKTWVMQGYPIDRTTASDGRWVYTLYGNSGGYPFVHALDTVRGVAHCVGLPWRGKQSAVYNMRLRLHGNSLAVRWYSGRPWYRVDTRTWRLSADHRGGVAWWVWAVLAGAAATILGGYGRRARTLAAGTARRDRGSARLGPWLPLTRPR